MNRLSLSKNLEKAVKRGHWVTVVTTLIYVSVILAIVLLQLGFTEGFLKLPELNLESLLRW